jgi:hypothetical protein
MDFFKKINFLSFIIVGYFSVIPQIAEACRVKIDSSDNQLITDCPLCINGKFIEQGITTKSCNYQGLPDISTFTLIDQVGSQKLYENTSLPSLTFPNKDNCALALMSGIGINFGGINYKPVAQAANCQLNLAPLPPGSEKPFLGDLDCEEVNNYKSKGYYPVFLSFIEGILVPAPVYYQQIALDFANGKLNMSSNEHTFVTDKYGRSYSLSNDSLLNDEQVAALLEGILLVPINSLFNAEIQVGPYQALLPNTNFSNYVQNSYVAGFDVPATVYGVDGSAQFKALVPVVGYSFCSINASPSPSMSPSSSASVSPSQSPSASASSSPSISVSPSQSPSAKASSSPSASSSPNASASSSPSASSTPKASASSSPSISASPSPSASSKPVDPTPSSSASSSASPSSSPTPKASEIPCSTENTSELQKIDSAFKEVTKDASYFMTRYANILKRLGEKRSLISDLLRQSNEMKNLGVQSWVITWTSNNQILRCGNDTISSKTCIKTKENGIPKLLANHKLVDDAFNSTWKKILKAKDGKVSDGLRKRSKSLNKNLASLLKDLKDLEKEHSSLPICD